MFGVCKLPLPQLAIAGTRRIWLLAVVVTVPAFAELEQTPLAPRSGPLGSTLFRTLSAAETGIRTDNSYADPRMWGDRYQEFALGAIGTGVTAGDYDNDGRPDLFVVSKTGESQLFRNLGDWKFANTTKSAGLGGDGSTVEAWKQGATFADVNNDGWLDLYVCRYDAPNLLYINQTDGTFREEAAARGLAIVSASGMASFHDYDRDGWLDAYLQTNMLNAVASPGGQRDFLLRNRGDGTFEDVTTRAGIDGENLAHSVLWWDYDQDGWSDIYVANDFGPPDRLYRNNGDGTFRDVIHEVVPQMPYSAMGADSGDVDNDGLIDFLVADMATTSHVKDQRGMASSRDLSREDADSPTLAPQMLRNALYLNTGRGVMREGAALFGVAATDWTWSTRFEDFDNDGWMDLHVTNGMNREYQNADLRNRVILMESATERLRVMKSSPELLENNLAYRNTGDRGFEEVGAKWGLNKMGVSFGAATADFDGDGDLDLVHANYEASVSVLRNDSQTGARAIVELRGSVSNHFGVGAQVTVRTASGVQVRELVLARGYLSSSQPVLHFGLGADERIDQLEVWWPSGHRQVFGDLAVNQHFQITEPAGAVELSPRALVAAGQFVEEGAVWGLSLEVKDTLSQEANAQPLMPTRFDRRGPALAMGDLNGNGRTDLIIGGSVQSGAQVQLASVGGRYAPSGSLPSGSLDDGPIAIFDADGDGSMDVLLTKGGSGRPAGAPDYQPRLFLNDGRGGFRSPPPDSLPELLVSVGAVAVADFDRDGRLDVFLGARLKPGRYPEPPQSALLHNQGGKFADIAATLAPALGQVGMVTSAVWSDVDDDGWPDLVITTEWGGVHGFRNESGKAFTDVSDAWGFTAAGTGWWTSVATGDFNRDGRPDFVLGNTGLNSVYRATRDEPTVIYVDSFGRGGRPQLIEGYYEHGNLYPRRTSKAIGAYVRTVRRQFAKNDDYAEATLPEILGEAKLAAADRYAATELRSGVLLSRADGSHAFSPLPRLAQIAPVQGMTVGDFNADGFLDVYMLQNSYAPIPSVGRFDGGVSQWFAGDGQGGFTAVHPRDSGLVVTGDAKALVTTDLDADGWPDFVVSRNTASSQAWRNSGRAGHGSFRLKLNGETGNPSGIGAKVLVQLADGSTVCQTVQAGGGYYSQSAGDLFWGYPENTPPVRIEVRWPQSGQTTTHEIEAMSATLITLSAR